VRKRIIFLPALLVLGATVVVFFVVATPRVPLLVRIIGMTNQVEGGVNICFSVSNQTSQPYYFFTYPQALSNTVWLTSVDDRGPFGGTKGLLPHASSEQIVYTYRNGGIMRLQVTYAPVNTPRQRATDDFLKKLGLRPLHDDRVRRELTTLPFELPLR